MVSRIMTMVLNSGSNLMYNKPIAMSAEAIGARQDDVKEVANGYECGMQVEKFNDIKVGDVIECFVMEQVNP